jgi:hypothetical protein
MREAEMGEMRKFGMFAPATMKRFGQILKRGFYWLAGALAGALTTGLVSRLVLFVGGRL